MTLSLPISLGRATYPVIYAVAAVLLSLCIMPLFRKKLDVKGKVRAARLHNTFTFLSSATRSSSLVATTPPIKLHSYKCHLLTLPSVYATSPGRLNQFLTLVLLHHRRINRPRPRRRIAPPQIRRPHLHRIEEPDPSGRSERIVA